MALPKLSTPVYTLKQPSTGDVIKYRPFLVKEEKILLTALESNDENTIIDATKQIISNCILSDNIDLETLPMFDIEYFFLQLRAKSVSDFVTLRYKNNACTMGDDGAACGKELQVMVKLDEIEIQMDPKHSSKIELGDGIGIYMRYPDLALTAAFQSNKPTQDSMFKMIATCVKTIYDKDEVYETSSFSKEEIEEFIYSMTQVQFEKVKDFFESMPQLKKEINVNCKKCGYDKKVVLSGLKDFFG